MDPVTAIGLAGTILKLIGTSGNIIRSIHGLNQSGTIVQTRATQLTSLSDYLARALSELSSSFSHAKLSNYDHELVRLSEECTEFSKTLKGKLENVGILTKHTDGAWEKVKYAYSKKLLSVFNHDELGTLERQLAAFRERITVCLLFELRQQATKSSAQQEEILRALKISTRGRKSDAFNSNLETLLQYWVGQAAHSKGPFTSSWSPSLREDILYMSYPRHTRDKIEAESIADGVVPKADSRKHLQSLLLSTIHYDGMEFRSESLQSAYKNTFEWVLRGGSRGSKTWDNFPQWLQSSDQLYWITGKAGSGKSTLMAFLTESITDPDPNVLKASTVSRCQPFLSKWAGEHGLVIVSFYFSATDLSGRQASREALLRTLLYKILRAQPDVISKILSVRWEALSIFGDHHRRLNTWTESDLKTCLIDAVRTLTDMQFHMCFFIDGLDEFQGSTQDMVDFITELSNLGPLIKICVASRPWAQFQDAFATSPNLLLQHLTYEDIKKFVTGSFDESTMVANLRQRNPVFASQLTENIVTKADGVFMWVKLVVKSLIAGCSYGDRIEDLQRRLDALPSDLEYLYDRIFEDLDPFYRAHAAKMVLLIESAKENLSLVNFSFADEETALSLRRIPVMVLDRKARELREDDMQRRLNSRWKGLIEVRGPTNEWQSSKHVLYSHATVKQYMLSQRVQSFLRSSLKDEAFDPHLQLCIAYCAAFKTRDCHALDDIERILQHASQVSSGYETDMISALDHLADTQILVTREPDSAQVILIRAAEHGVTPYIRAKLEKSMNPTLLNDLLSISISRPLSTLCIKTVTCLLDKGADPNQGAWALLLYRTDMVCELSKLDEPLRLTIVAFVKHGADTRVAEKMVSQKYHSQTNVDLTDVFLNDLGKIEVMRRKPVQGQRGKLVKKPQTSVSISWLDEKLQTPLRISWPIEKLLNMSKSEIRIS